MKLKTSLQNALASYANNIAIEIEDTSITYAELQAQSQKMAHFLGSKIRGGGKINLT